MSGERMREAVHLYCSNILAFSYHEHVQENQKIIPKAAGTCTVPNVKPR